ncbi:hypothetical protein [Streptomyces sp. NBC_01320]|nr:hypothetical protein OG395_14340 [Streptomyces sp. NBC_01320]
MACRWWKPVRSAVGLDNYTQPILVCYLVRYFVKGLTGGATQG